MGERKMSVMKAIVFDGSLKCENDRPVPQPARGEALIRVRIAGICNTDQKIVRGYAGFKGVLGHEFVGVVEEVNGDGANLKGKRVVGEINIGCGTCEYCRTGLKEHCVKRRVTGIHGKDGAMADYVTLPTGNLHIVPDEVTDEEAVFTEPLAAAFQILNQVHFRPSCKVLVMGDGKLGLLISLVLSRSAVDVALAGKHESKLVIARAQKVITLLADRLGSEHVYDAVIDATGSAGGFEMALDLVKPRGILVLKSTVAEKNAVNLSSVVVHEITVLGSRCGPFAPALRALADGSVDVKPLITAVFPPGEALKAFAADAGKESLKVLIDFK
jgi:threonine dehydrogenase-like Zn-dependent dehydrogenase